MDSDCDNDNNSSIDEIENDSGEDNGDMPESFSLDEAVSESSLSIVPKFRDISTKLIGKLLQTVVNNKDRILQVADPSVLDNAEVQQHKARQRAVLSRILDDKVVNLTFEETRTLGEVLNELGLIDE